MAVKDRFDGVEWKLWADDIKLRWGPAMDYYREELYFDIEFHQYMQFKFYEQWMQLKTYANKKGIQIIGDIPIYVAMDSADTWAHPELFQLDEENVPVAVAGCPPGRILRNRTNYGEIHSTAGDIIKKQDISGGYLVWHMCSACTM